LLPTLGKCLNANGRSLTDQTETCDVSEAGISFYLKTLVWMNGHLILTIADNIVLGRPHTVSVRVQTDPSSKQLVTTHQPE
jgi:hypothetical protein